MKEIPNCLNLLIIEDDEEILQNLKDTLSFVFSDIYCAADGLIALEIFDNNHIDIIISDYVLPNLDGYNFVKMLREKSINTPIILLSSYMDVEKLQKCIPLNLIHFLEKPVSLDVLLGEIQICIEKIKKESINIVKLSNSLTFDSKRNLIYRENESIKLTFYENGILKLLINYKNQIVEYHLIANALSMQKEELSKEAIKNIIYRLRKKMNQDIITSHRNLGYSLN
ncbi:response regulator transcription factor [Poseidonibacter sp.]|uniref:response regulator transcription factor n=1 Tax=Poseidonibacter sp. TaxID=2321188 RepID=UPI003C768C36